MPICFICKEELLNIKVLRIHFEFKHKQVKFYKCVEIGCQSRKFDTFKSLKKHFDLHHNIQESLSINQDKTLSNQQNVDRTSSDLDLDLDLDQDNDNDNFFGNSDPSNLNGLLNHNGSDLKNCTIDKVASFFARLLSNYGLPRNHAQNLYQEVQGLFFNDCFRKIEDFLISIPISDNNEIAIGKIQSICKDYKDSFALMSTEYRRMKYFVKNEKYVAP